MSFQMGLKRFLLGGIRKLQSICMNIISMIQTGTPPKMSFLIHRHVSVIVLAKCRQIELCIVLTRVSSKKTRFWLYIDLSGNMNCVTFSVVPSIIIENSKMCWLH